mmetsp:Transcript_47531/g.75172  ORF Transcript_47531/g.75172 Transcript_47531/m.75172 type:complete len:162 (-) Transcript_47531:224-709(-)
MTNRVANALVDAVAFGELRKRTKRIDELTEVPSDLFDELLKAGAEAKTRGRHHLVKHEHGDRLVHKDEGLCPVSRRAPLGSDTLAVTSKISIDILMREVGIFSAPQSISPSLDVRAATSRTFGDPIVSSRHCLKMPVGSAHRVALAKRRSCSTPHIESQKR